MTRKSVAIAAAIKAGAFIKKNVGKVRKVTYKGAINLVTDIDKKAEDIVISQIQCVFPDDSILSEEAGSRERTGEFRLIIDPLDGTTNFFRSFPFFAVSIAVESEDGLELGVIYDPLRDELFYAEKGRGAFLNRRRIHVSKIKKLSKSFLATGFSYKIRTRHNTNVNNFRKFLKSALAIRRAGSAALDLAYVACGRFDGFWEFDLYPWDAAAGYVLVKEAGGVVTKFDGTCYTLSDKDILTSNQYIHKQMSSVLVKI